MRFCIVTDTTQRSNRNALITGSIIALTGVLLIARVVYAQGGDPPDYREIPGISSRIAIWITSQVHLMFAAFMLGVPMFSLVVEFVGARTGDKRYDDLAREFTKLVMVAASTTAAFGALFTFLLFTLYPNFMSRLTDVFLPSMLIYPLLFFGEIFTLYLYWYSWDRLNTPRGKPWHLGLGLLLNLFGTALMFVANAWLSFTISPESGGQSMYDSLGNFTGTVWQAMNNATWMPINLHRTIANIAFGGAIVGMYAAMRFLNAKTDEERARYDWMGYMGNFIAVIGLIPLPFAGYVYGREIYAFSQQMGVTMMGGFLSWLWILQAMLIAVIFLSANYYLWSGMERIEGGERYRGVVKVLLLVLTLGVLVWATPHNPVVTPAEQAQIGGAFHPLLGVMGVMSAKNTAVNMMILATFLSFLFYRRAGKGEPLPFAQQGKAAQIVLGLVVLGCLVLAGSPAVYVLREGLNEPTRLLRVALTLVHGLTITAGVVLTLRDRGKLGQWLIIASATFVVIFFGIYGYFVDSFVRIGFSVYQVLAVLTALIAVTAIDVYLYRSAPNIGKIHWGKMPARTQYVLILLAVTFTWLMGLMGYARNAIRQHWHIYEVLQDTSVDAFSPSLGYAARVISVCVLLFLGLMGFIFWLGSLSEAAHQPSPALQPVPPEDETKVTESVAVHGPASD